MDGLVLLLLLLQGVEDTLVESVGIHLELDNRFVSLTLGIFRSLQSDGNLETKLFQLIIIFDC